MAVKSIANKCDAIYVIGGENSSNSIRLVEVAKKSGCRNNFLVSDINSGRLEGNGKFRSIGLTLAQAHLKF